MKNNTPKTQQTEFSELNVSIRSLSALTGLDRDTIRQAFSSAELTPAGTRGGYPSYQLQPAIRALFARRGDIDPAMLTPGDRKNLALAQRAEFDLEIKRGEFLPRDAYRRASATAFAKVASTIRSLPDNLERKAGLEPATVDLVEQIVDSTLDELAGDLEKTYTENSD
jgi:hypothetical protein